MNPFRSALVSTFDNEKEQAIRVSNAGGISENEQLIWVLWKILRGDGNDVCFSDLTPICPVYVCILAPNTLADSLSVISRIPRLHPSRPRTWLRHRCPRSCELRILVSKVIHLPIDRSLIRELRQTLHSKRCLLNLNSDLDLQPLTDLTDLSEETKMSSQLLSRTRKRTPSPRACR